MFYPIINPMLAQLHLCRFVYMHSCNGAPRRIAIGCLDVHVHPNSVRSCTHWQHFYTRNVDGTGVGLLRKFHVYLATVCDKRQPRFIRSKLG